MWRLATIRRHLWSLATPRRFCNNQSYTPQGLSSNTSRGFGNLGFGSSAARFSNNMNSDDKQMGCGSISKQTGDMNSKLNSVSAGNISDFTEGVPKQIQVGEDQDNTILVIKAEGKMYATASKCCHFNLPLAGGYVDGMSIICPFHMASFDISSGEMLSPPALDSIKAYTTSVVGDEVFVQIPQEDMESVAARRVSSGMVKPDGSDSRTFVIIGGGAAGNSCAETLRRNGFHGKIKVISEESQVPYNRIVLSKNIKADTNTIGLRAQQFYDEYGIEILLGTKAVSIDEKAKTIQTSGGDISYDKLCIATGGKARIPPPYQSSYDSYDNVFSIRNAKDHTLAKSKIESTQDVVIIGGSFLGLEAACSIRNNFPDKNVTVIEMFEHPLRNIMGPEIAQQLVDAQIAAGVRVITGTAAKSINGEGSSASSVTIETGGTEENIPAGAVMISTGAAMNTEGLVPSSLLNPDGTVPVDEFLRSTSNADIYAAGDIASFPSRLTNASNRVEHWNIAQEHGMTAAENMLGLGKPYDKAPFFWTNQFANAQFVGYCYEVDWTFNEAFPGEGDKPTGNITYLFRGEKCQAVATCNKMGAAIRFKIALERGLMPTKEELTSGKVNYEEISKRVAASSPCKKPGGCCKDKANISF